MHTTHADKFLDPRIGRETFRLASKALLTYPYANTLTVTSAALFLILPFYSVIRVTILDVTILQGRMENNMK